MIVKMIPETEEEKQRYASKGLGSIEHTGVREFLIFGNKIDNEGDLADFHEWHGSFRYLMGGCNFFYEIINDKRKSQGTSEIPEIQMPLKVMNQSKPMIKKGETEGPLTPIDISQFQKEAERKFEEDEDTFGEDVAVEVDNQEIAVEELDEQADKIAEEQADIQPVDLKILK